MAFIQGKNLGGHLRILPSTNRSSVELTCLGEHQPLFKGNRAWCPSSDLQQAPRMMVQSLSPGPTQQELWAHMGAGFELSHHIRIRP